MIDLRDQAMAVDARWGDGESATFTAVTALPAVDGTTYVVECCWRDGVVQSVDTVEVRAPSVEEAMGRVLRALVAVVGPLDPPAWCN